MKVSSRTWSIALLAAIFLGIDSLTGFTKYKGTFSRQPKPSLKGGEK